MKAVLAVAVALLAAWPATAETLVDIPAIMGQPKAVVEKTLGKPTKCEKIKYGDKCSYTPHSASVVFIKNAADWISIQPENAPFAEKSLELFNFVKDEPAFWNQHVMRWKDLIKVKDHSTVNTPIKLKPDETLVLPVLEVQFSQGARGLIDLVYVKVSTR